MPEEVTLPILALPRSEVVPKHEPPLDRSEAISQRPIFRRMHSEQSPSVASGQALPQINDIVRRTTINTFGRTKSDRPSKRPTFGRLLSGQVSLTGTQRVHKPSISIALPDIGGQAQIGGQSLRQSSKPKTSVNQDVLPSMVNNVRDSAKLSTMVPVGLVKRDGNDGSSAPPPDIVGRVSTGLQGLQGKKNRKAQRSNTNNADLFAAILNVVEDDVLDVESDAGDGVSTESRSVDDDDASHTESHAMSHMVSISAGRTESKAAQTQVNGGAYNDKKSKRDSYTTRLDALSKARVIHELIKFAGDDAVRIHEQAKNQEDAELRRAVQALRRKRRAQAMRRLFRPQGHVELLTSDSRLVGPSPKECSALDPSGGAGVKRDASRSPRGSAHDPFGSVSFKRDASRSPGVTVVACEMDPSELAVRGSCDFRRHSKSHAEDGARITATCEPADHDIERARSASFEGALSQQTKQKDTEQNSTSEENNDDRPVSASHGTPERKVSLTTQGTPERHLSHSGIAEQPPSSARSSKRSGVSSADSIRSSRSGSARRLRKRGRKSQKHRTTFRSRSGSHLGPGQSNTRKSQRKKRSKDRPMRMKTSARLRITMRQQFGSYGGKSNVSMHSGSATPSAASQSSTSDSSDADELAAPKWRYVARAIKYEVKQLDAKHNLSALPLLTKPVETRRRYYINAAEELGLDNADWNLGTKLYKVTVDELRNIAEEKHHRIADAAALRIQTKWRNYKTNWNLHQIVLDMQRSAATVQQYWRHCLYITIPLWRTIQRKKQKVANVIKMQAWFRGLKARNAHRNFIAMRKIKKEMDDLSAKTMSTQVHNILFIQTLYRRRLDRIRKRQLESEKAVDKDIELNITTSEMILPAGFFAEPVLTPIEDVEFVEDAADVESKSPKTLKTPSPRRYSKPSNSPHMPRKHPTAPPNPARRLSTAVQPSSTPAASRRKSIAK